MTEKIGRYEVKAELGRGGFGRVYRAWDPTVGRMVAIKTLNAGGDPELLQRFRNEAAAAGKLRHRNIIIIYDYGEQEGEPYIVMELLDGEDLQRVMKNRRRLSLLQKMQIMDRVAEGLDHAHRNGVVHRDVKPANMMLLPDFSVKIMDFGIALVTQLAGTRLTKTGTVPGTLKYMAPEQFRGATNDPLSDVFSFGVTYYEFITGVHPFDGPATPAIMYNILSVDARPARELCPECPEGLEQVLQRCMLREREARYPSLDDMRFDLKPIIAELQHDHAQGLLSEAERLAEVGQLETAQALLREVVELDPANRKARQLRERLQQQALKQAVRPKVEALLDTGRHLIAARQFKDAINTLESALKLDKNSPEISALLRQVQTIEQQAAAAERLVSEAKSAFHNRDLTGAYQKATEALQQDPSHPDAVQLIHKVREEIFTAERDRKLRDDLGRARGALLVGAFDDAITLLASLKTEFPDSTEVHRLHETALTEKQEQERKERIASVVAETRQLLKAKQLNTAVNRLEDLLQQFPDAEEVRNLLSYAQEELKAKKRQEHVERLLREVQGLVQAQNFDAAIQMLEKGLVYFPGELVISKQLDTVRAAQNAYLRQQALDDALTMGELLREDSRFGEALETLAAFTSAYGAEPRVDDLRRQIEKEAAQRKREEAIRTFTNEVGRLLDAGDAATAIKVAESALGRYPGEAELKALLTKAQDRLRAQQRTEAVQKLVQEVDQLTSTHLFDVALDLIDKGIQTYPGESELDRAKRKAIEAKAGFDRIQAVAKTAAEARRHIQRRELELAVESCETLLRTYKHESEIEALLDDARLQIRQRDERARAIAAILEDGAAKLAAGDFAGAIQSLEKGSKKYPDEQRFADQLQHARSEKIAYEREQSILAALGAIEALRAGKNWEQALARVDDALRQFDTDSRLKQLRQRIQSEWDAEKKRLAEERAAAVNQVCRDAESLRQSARFSEALNALSTGTTVLGPDGKFDALRKRIQTEWDQAKRAEAERAAAIAKVIQQAEQSVARNQYDTALSSLDQALLSYPGEPSIAAYREKVVAAKTAHELEQRAARDRAVSRACTDAESRRKGGQYAEALDLLAQTVATHGPDERMEKLRLQVQEEWDQKKRAEAQRAAAIASAVSQADEKLERNLHAEAAAVVDKALKSFPAENSLLRCRERASAEALRQEGRFGEAIGLLAAATRSYGADPKVERDRKRIQAEWDQKNRVEAERAAAIAKVVDQAEKNSAANKHDAALSLLDNALKSYPAEQSLIDSRERIAFVKAAFERQQEIARQEAIQQLCRDADSLFERGQYRQALDKLAAGTASYGPDARIEELRTKVQAAHERALALENLIARASQAQAENRFDAAIALLDDALRTSPADPAVKKARENALSAKTSAAIAKLVAKAEQETAQRNFDSALATLDEALKSYPGEQSLLRCREQAVAAKSAEERGAAVSAVLQDAAQDLGQGRFDAAIAILDAGLRTFSGEPSLAKERDKVLKAKAAVIAQLIAQAERELSQNQFDVATRLLDDAMAAHPGEGSLVKAREKAVSAKAAYERQRAEAERNAAVARLVETANQEIVQNRFDAAISQLDGGLKSYPGDAALTRSREKAVTAKATYERQRAEAERAAAVASLIAKADQELAQSRFDSAVSLLDGALKSYPGDAALTKSREKAVAAKSAFERQRAEAERAAAVASLIAKADQELAQSRFDAAISLLDGALKSYPGDAALTRSREKAIAAKSAVERQRAEAERAAAVARLVEKADQEIAQNRFDAAISLLDGALKSYTGDAALTRSRQKAIAAKTEAERAGAVAMVIAQADQELAHSRFDGAVSVLDGGLKSYPGDPTLTQHRSEVVAAKAQTIDQAIRTADSLRQNGQYSDAQAALTAAIHTLGADPVLEQKLKQVRTENDKKQRADAERATAVAKATEKAEQQLVQGKHDKALSVVDTALKSYPDEQALLSLREEILAAKAAAPVRTEPARVETARSETEPLPAPPSKSGLRMGLIAAGVAVALGVGYVATMEKTPPQEVPEVPTPAPTAVPTPTPTPVPTPTPPPQQVAQGRVLIKAGIAGADVLLDSKRVGQTDASGNFQLPLAVKDYAVRVEKQGYNPAPPQNVSIRKDAQQQLTFLLTPMEATLAMRRATPGAQVKIDSRVVGTVGPDGSFATRIGPGEHSIELTKDQHQARSFTRRLDPGQNVVLDGGEVILTAIPKADPNAAVAQEWERLKGGRDIAQLEGFVQRNRTSPFGRLAEDRIQELRWEAVDKRNIGALRDYSTRYSSSPYARTAADTAARLEWDAVDKNNLKALQDFRQRNSQNEYAARATREIERLEQLQQQQQQQQKAQSEKLAADRANAERLKGEREAILQALNQYAAAFGRKDPRGMTAAFPSAPVDRYREAFKVGNSFSMTLRPLGEPEISGDTATLACEHSTVISARGQKGGSAPRQVKVVLAKRGGSWIIQSMD